MLAAEKKPFVCTVAPLPRLLAVVWVWKSKRNFTSTPHSIPSASTPLTVSLSPSSSLSVSVACYPCRFPWQLAMPFGGNFRANCQVLFGFRVLCMQNLTNFHNIHTTSTYTRTHTHNRQHTTMKGTQAELANKPKLRLRSQAQLRLKLRLRLRRSPSFLSSFRHRSVLFATSFFATL